MTADLPAAPAVERPCRPCQDDQHERCLMTDLWEFNPGCCCCDDLDRDPDPPRWHP